jgi:hypothetical protein
VAALESQQLVSHFGRLGLAEVQPRHAFLAVVALLALLIPVSAAAEQGHELPSAKVGALTFTYTTRFYRRDFMRCDFIVTGVHGSCVQGAVVANVRLGRDPELGASYPWLPLTVAKFELVLAAPQPGVLGPVPSYPLSLRDLHDSCRGCAPLRGQRFAQISFFFRANDANYWAIAWVGKRISRPDHQALESIVASIHPS